jgi:hypothetical protein
MGRPRRQPRGNVRLGALLLVAGALFHVASVVTVFRFARSMQQAAGAGLGPPPAPSVVLLTVLTWGAILLLGVGFHQALWAPPRNGRLYLPVRLSISAALGLALFFGLTYVGGVVMALLMA